MLQGHHSDSRAERVATIIVRVRGCGQRRRATFTITATIITATGGLSLGTFTGARGRRVASIVSTARRRAATTVASCEQKQKKLAISVHCFRR